MSAAVNYIAENTNVQGPSIGNEGGLGLPSLEVQHFSYDDGEYHSYSFGWIYSGLDSIGLVTEEVEHFKEFLLNNQDNEILMFVEGGDDLNAERIDWDHLKKYTPTKKSEFKSCLYCIKNESSGEVLEIKTKCQKLKPIEKTLSQEDVSNFIEKLLDAEMINDSFHNTHGILFAYEELGEIERFISSNRSGKLHVSVIEIQ